MQHALELVLDVVAAEAFELVLQAPLARE